MKEKKKPDKSLTRKEAKDEKHWLRKVINKGLL